MFHIREKQIDAKKSNFDIFESALCARAKSGSMPLSCRFMKNKGRVFCSF